MVLIWQFHDTDIILIEGHCYSNILYTYR